MVFPPPNIVNSLVLMAKFFVFVFLIVTVFAWKTYFKNLFVSFYSSSRRFTLWFN